LKIRTYHKIFITCFLVFIVCSYAVYTSDWFKRTFVCPFNYQPIIYQYALEHDLSPFLIAGVIKVESSFKPDAMSHRGAMGLMQIMPDTGKWVGERLQDPIYLDKNTNKDMTLKDPEINIQLGTWYLNFLRSEFFGNEVLYLAAYNGGMGNVRKWMEKYDWSEEFSDIDQIPFSETRNYVKRVLYYKEQYQEIYGR
jgi:soluble lytic murein transglycosylase